MNISKTLLAAILTGIACAAGTALLLVAVGTPAAHANTDPLFSYQQPS